MRVQPAAHGGVGDMPVSMQKLSRILSATLCVVLLSACATAGPPNATRRSVRTTSAVKILKHGPIAVALGHAYYVHGSVALADPNVHYSGTVSYMIINPDHTLMFDADNIVYGTNPLSTNGARQHGVKGQSTLYVTIDHSRRPSFLRILH